MNHSFSAKKAAIAVGTTTAGVVGLVGFGAPAAHADEPITVSYTSTVDNAVHDCSIEGRLFDESGGPDSHTLNVSTTIPSFEDDPFCAYFADADVTATYRQEDSGTYVTQHGRSSHGWAEMTLSNVADSDVQGNKIDTTHTITFRDCSANCTASFSLSHGKAA